MAQAHHCPKLDDQVPLQTLLLARVFPLHNLNRVVMEAILVISSKAMGFMVTKLEVNTAVVLAGLLPTKPLAKEVTKAVTVTKVTKASVVAATMAAASNNNSSVADGVATTDTNLAQQVAQVLGRLPILWEFHQICVTITFGFSLLSYHARIWGREENLKLPGLMLPLFTFNTVFN